jgi:Phage integrase family
VRDGLDALPGGDDFLRPGPGGSDFQGSAASAADEAGAGVQDAVAQRLRLRPGQGAVQGQELQPLWVDLAEIPSGGDVGGLGRALGAGVRGSRDELMANTAAYSGLRWGELAALTIWQVDEPGRVIAVDRKVVEVAGRLYHEAPKNRKFRRTIYPSLTPGGYPLADRLAARVKEACAEQEAGTNPLGLIFPSPAGKYWRSSNFSRNVLESAYLEAGWRDSSGEGQWTWHSLRHVFCTTALFTWKLDPTGVSRMAGHANYRITLDMYVNSQELHQLGEKPQVSRSRDHRNGVPLVLMPAL